MVQASRPNVFDHEYQPKDQPMAALLVFNILNLTIVNAYVIHVSNAIRNGTKPMKRRPFALQMADDLMKPWLQEISDCNFAAKSEAHHRRDLEN
ncbi:hypothetical protein EVAR_80254_1 [Eumeta japonica]|uniref:PiggyBac transposable element-derived protein domain-containing protein n=1 Tax=Eumeta variegata TaxID=151549 RepID=A0A4C1UBY6_EUMVA|nr:hypothetical protein EVAR_80254_1 [Eumeta japonica]